MKFNYNVEGPTSNYYRIGVTFASDCTAIAVTKAIAIAVCNFLKATRLQLRVQLQLWVVLANAID